MDKKEEGNKKFKDFVYNKMKPKWLFEQVATHALETFWIVWIDVGINKDVNLANMLAFTSAGFDIQPFKSWKQYKIFAEKCKPNEYSKKEVLVLCEPDQRDEVFKGIEALKPA